MTNYFVPVEGASLLDKEPQLCEEWDDSNDLMPAQLRVSSSYKAKWKCRTCKQTWTATVNNRVARQTGCPYCLKSCRNPSPEQLALRLLWTNKTGIETYGKASSKLWPWKCPDCGYEFEQIIRYFKGKCTQCCQHLDGKRFGDVAPHLLDEWSSNNPSPEMFSYNSAFSALWECSYHHEWRATVYQRVNSNTQCPTCSMANHTSQAEDELAELFDSLQLQYLRNDRSILQGKELDFYFPSLNVAIEYNGVYWHTEQKTPSRSYHYDKWAKCKEQGIQLITIWSDDYETNPSLVKRMLQHKLHQDTHSRIGARQTTPVSISYAEATEFLNQYHIQGSRQGTLYTALRDANGLVAVSVWSRRGNGSTWLLERYATSCTVAGGLGKLLRHFTQLHPEVQRIRTFASHDVSSGSLYEQLNFCRVGEIKPDYTYLIGGKRVHKANYRRQRFEQDDRLQYEASYSETQLAELNGLARVWDTGKTIYELLLS